VLHENKYTYQCVVWGGGAGGTMLLTTRHPLLVGGAAAIGCASGALGAW
jgi:hypothetical protein